MTREKMKKLLMLSLFFCLFAPAWGNISPKPEMEFSFIYQTADKPAIDPQLSEQIQCQDNQCIESKPLGIYGLQKLYCKADGCFSIAYAYDPYQKLIISFADGTKKESNVFAAPGTLRSHFNVYVNPTDLTVEIAPKSTDSRAWVRKDAWVSLAIILLLELFAAAAYLSYREKSFTILYSVGLANLLTTAVSWLLLALYVKETAFLWIFCLVAEALIIRLMNPRKISFQDSAMLSLVTNVTSYSLGMIFSFLLAPLIF